MYPLLQGKGEKMPEIPADIKRGIQDYRKAVHKQVTPVLEKVTICFLGNLIRKLEDD